MKLKILIFGIMTGSIFLSCNQEKDKFDFFVEQFADIKILRYQVPEFDELTLKQKELIYYLSQAALAGRDILADQNGKYNLAIRRTLDNIVKTYTGNKESEDFMNFMVYTKRIWFSNGIYHHYSTDKILPEFSSGYFKELVQNSNQSGIPVKEGQTVSEFLDVIIPVMFHPDVLPKKVLQDPTKDIVANSAVNFYENITQKEVEEYYNKLKDPDDLTPVEYGLNTIVKKENGQIKEEVWYLGGKYGEAIKEIIKWLEKAETVAENEKQEAVIHELISYYKTGDLEKWSNYNVLWVNDLDSRIDFINGFIEVYSDPMGIKGTWESVVNFKDLEATKRTEIISSNAQWFEDHSPIDDKFKKKEVKGVTAKVINVAQLGGDCYPHTPIGINLPNSEWIRKEHGSKSVTIENITYAYDQASQGSGFLEEFSADDEEIALIKEYGFITGNLHTDMHECLGHGSGQLMPGVTGDNLKNYYSPIEETRADLFALYYMMDEKMVELGLLPNLEAAKAEYIGYFRNGLMTQLTRIKTGNTIEQAHMRNRQLIAKWCFDKGKEENVIEEIKKDSKTYYKINDFNKLRSYIADLLKEIQRIRSEGDYEAAKNLVETYGVQINQNLHKEVLDRFEKLKLAPYAGFINPEYELIEKKGEIKDVKVTYPNDFVKQMLKYGEEYSFLPTYN